jgi:tRNA (cytidine/uridine-2'-O-)-methyltransferase
MFSVILYEPEIPPNTGNIIRLCANTGADLHLIEPLGFELDEKRLRRAGLDYREFVNVRSYESLDNEATFNKGDAFLFGPETRGLPQVVLEAIPTSQRLRLPMQKGNRSLNLSNAAAVVVYEAWRQLGFAGGT